MLNAALAQIERTGEKVDHAEIFRLKGDVLLNHDRSAISEAENCFRQGLGIAQTQEAKWWELRTSVILTRLLRDTNRRDEARTILSKIYNWFTEGFDTADLKDAKALLDELGRYSPWCRSVEIAGWIREIAIIAGVHAQANGTGFVLPAWLLVG
jgi:predicted ATPase